MSSALITTRQLAEQLGISLRFAKRLLADGEIPSYSIRGSRRIDPDDVRAYLDANLNERAVA